MLIMIIVGWAELEALDISLLDTPGGKEILADQVLRFINKNGIKNVFNVSRQEVDQFQGSFTSLATAFLMNKSTISML